MSELLNANQYTHTKIKSKKVKRTGNSNLIINHKQKQNGYGLVVMREK